MGRDDGFLASLVVTERTSGRVRLFSWVCSCGRVGVGRPDLDKTIEVAMKHLDKVHAIPELRRRHP